jgi:hypothetical protein
VVSFTLLSLYPLETTPGTDLTAACAAPEAVWTLWRGENTYPSREQYPARPARRLSIYRLSYPGSQAKGGTRKKHTASIHNYTVRLCWWMCSCSSVANNFPYATLICGSLLLWIPKARYGCSIRSNRKFQVHVMLPVT